MKTTKINNVNVTLDFSNQFVIARIQENYSDWETFFLVTSDIVATVAHHSGVSALDVELIAIGKNNKFVVFTSNTMHSMCLFDSFQAHCTSGYFLGYDNIEPKLIIEKMKEFYTPFRIGECFREVIVEPSSGSEISDVVKEMKSLSEIIGMPVCAEFNGKNLRITSATDVTHTVNCYWKGIDTDSVSQKP
ncbi:MAG: hypothetical protein J6J35_02875 [Alphaproteobacteria bacterium]|nr:hypothetical protein [Alphaproteobacteria bacterium]